MTRASEPGTPAFPDTENASVADVLTRTILDQAAEAILVCDPNGVIVRASRAAVALAGRNCLHEQFVTAFPVDVAGVGHADRLIARILHGETFNAVDARLPHKASTEDRWLLVSAAPLHSGENSGCVVSLVDVTARKLVEGDLRASEARYRALVDLAPDAIVVHRAGRFVYANSAALQLYGASSPDDLAGRPVLDLIHPDDRSEVNVRIDDVTRGGSVPLRVVRLLRLDGTTVSAESTASLIEYERVNAVQVVLRDVSERTRAEEERQRFLAEARRHAAETDAILASQTDAVLTYDTDLKVQQANPAFSAIYGFDPVGLSVVQIMERVACRSLDGRPLVMDELPTPRALKGETVTDALFAVRRADGTEALVQASSAPMREGERTVGSVTVWHDVTYLRRVDAEVARLATFPELNPSPVVEADVSGAVLFCNPSATRLFPDLQARGLDHPWLSGWASATAATREAPAAPTKREVSIGQRWYEQTIVAVDEGRRFRIYGHDITDRKRAADLETALNAVHRAIFAFHHPDEVMRTVVAEAGKAIGCDTAVISLREGGRWVARYAWGFGPGVVGAEMDDDEERHAVLAITSHQPIAIDDTSTDDRVNREHMRKWGIRSVLVVPLMTRRDVQGALFLNFKKRPYSFKETDVDFAVKLATAASLALENACLVDDLNRELLERTRVQEALRESRDYLENLFRCADVAIICWDPRFVVTRFNPAFERLTGYRADEVIGRDLALFFPEATRAESIAEIRRTLAGERWEGVEIPIRRSNDDVRIAVWNSANVYSVDGTTVVATIAQGQDITERKQIEKELQRSHESLQQFAYVASHDLQEPLRMMASYSQLLERRYKDRLDSDADEFIGFITDGAARMQRLINDLLAYSRVGRGDTPPERVDCNAVLRRVLDALSPGIEGSGAVITSEDLPVVTGVESRFIQLFQNLVGNAIKFRGPEPPRIHVGAVKAQGEWVFSIKDNGIGIEPRYGDRVFQVFQRLHGRGEYPGTGIGLAICKKIVETHEGRIWVDSDGCNGSTFHFTVPASGGTADD